VLEAAHIEVADSRNHVRMVGVESIALAGSYRCADEEVKSTCRSRMVTALSCLLSMAAQRHLLEFSALSASYPETGDAAGDSQTQALALIKSRSANMKKLTACINRVAIAQFAPVYHN
jgi:hypothetical protein